MYVQKVLLTPVSVQRGIQLDPRSKSYLKKKNGTELAPYLYTPKTTLNQQKKKKKKKKIQNIYRFKMAANVLISTSQKRSCDQNWKNHIPKEKVGR